MQADALLLLLAWIPLLAFLAWAKKEQAQLFWLILVALVAASPLLAWIWPSLR